MLLHDINAGRAAESGGRAALLSLYDINAGRAPKPSVMTDAEYG